MEEISYKYLREVHQREKNSPLLSRLEDDFYQGLNEYLKNLEKEYNLIEDKDLPKAKLLRDEIENAKRTAENIYEQREKKIVQAALVARKGGRPNIENLTPAEKNLFESIVNSLRKGYENIFHGKKPERNVEYIKKEEKEKGDMLLKINQEIPEFVDSDGNRYSLKKEDVVTLPREIANALINRKVAEKEDLEN
ncbi:MAG: DNA replication complex GINS family protein [Thermoplasmata archaeon]|nr:DNA replication complex GINS family protein [Thermoplasmata archaeon]